MNKRQKIVQQQFLNNEEAVIKRLKQVYNQSLKDIKEKAKALQDDINQLGTMANLAANEAEKAQLLSMQQSKIYQKQYQDAMKKQIGSILDNMQVEGFKTVSGYLQKCYEDGFIGTLYDLQGQGVPLCFPLDQEAMVRAVQLDSKISGGLYSRLGEDVALLKKKITAQVSRGISTGISFQQVAQQLAGYTNIGYNNAVRIARTEGHRIQVQSTMDACEKAKDKGADVVKQWDAALDARTRESHVAVDGEIRELDEKFSNGLMFPGDSAGGAAEVVNCRCALLQRARWAMDGGFTKMNNFTKQIEAFDGPEDYQEFKKSFFSKENISYIRYAENMEDKYGTKNFEKLLGEMTDKEYDKYSLLTVENPIFNAKGIGIGAESSTMRMGVVRDAVYSKSVSAIVNAQKQNRHIVGSGEFTEGRSRLTIGLDDVQRLVDELKGTGDPIFDKSGEWMRKERVEGKQFIGIHVDQETGEEIKTKKFTIIYSKTGSHIVPRRDDA